MPLISLDEAQEYTKSSSSDVVSQIFLDGIVAELNDRIPSNAGGPRYKVLALQLWELLVRYEGTDKSKDTDYVKEKDRLYRDVGWSPRSLVNLERFVLPEPSVVLIDTQIAAAITTHTAEEDAHHPEPAAWAEVGDVSIIPSAKLPPIPAARSSATVQALARAVVWDWAEQGDASQIPIAKLPPIPGVNDIDARIASWARYGNTDNIPSGKLGNVAAIALGGISSWAHDGNAGLIPVNKLPPIPSARSDAQVQTLARAVVSDWAEESNATQIPLNKLGNAPGGGDMSGLNQTQVESLISDWAEEGNATLIPGSKLANAPGLSASQVQSLLHNWALLSNTDVIPIAKIPDLPYSHLSVIETWAVKDAIPPVEIIPNERLPVARFLPTVTSSDNGQILKVSGGSWGIGSDLVGETGSGLDQDAVDLRVAVGTKQFARAASDHLVPSALLPASTTLLRGGVFEIETTTIEATGGNSTPYSWSKSGIQRLINQETRSVYSTTSETNINNNIVGTKADDILLELVSGTLKIWIRLNTNSSPFWSLIGSVTAGGSVTVGSLTPFISPFAFIGNESVIPAARLPFSVEPWAQGTMDIPYSAFNETVESWAIKDASPPLEIIPDVRLPVARLLPAVTGSDDGKVAKVVSGAWAVGTDLQGSGGGAATTVDAPRWEFVRGEDTPDPFTNAGKVFLGFRYIDIYRRSDNVRTEIQDLTALAFIPAADDATQYTISYSEALDVREILAQSSVTAVMELITSLPTPGTAAWGRWYGLADTQGRVEDVYYRREESTTEQLWLPARLDSQNRDLHGFTTLHSDLTYGYERGGALSPEAEVVELVEEKDANGNYTTRLIYPNNGVLHSDISVILFWKSADQGYTTAREIPLFHDTSYTSSEHRRYVSAVYTDAFKFIPGTAYTIKWRIAGSAHDVVTHAAEALRRVADEEDLSELRAALQSEFYSVEDRVAVLEAAEGGGGGGPVGAAAPERLIDAEGLLSSISAYALGEEISPTANYEFLIRAGSSSSTAYGIATGRQLLALALQTTTPNTGQHALGLKITNMDNFSGTASQSFFSHDNLAIWRGNNNNLYMRDGRPNASGKTVTVWKTPFGGIQGERGIPGTHGTSGGLTQDQVDARIAQWGRIGTNIAGARGFLGLGTAALLNTGTSEGDVPILDSSGMLPASTYTAVSGGGLTSAQVTALIATWGVAGISTSTARSRLELGTAATATVGDTEGRLPALSQDGSFDTGRIPSLNTSKITEGLFHVDRIPNLAAGKITSAVFDSARLAGTNNPATGSVLTKTNSGQAWANLAGASVSFGSLTQAEYDALSTYDADQLYLIVG